MKLEPENENNFRAYIMTFLEAAGYATGQVRCMWTLDRDGILLPSFRQGRHASGALSHHFTLSKNTSTMPLLLIQLVSNDRLSK